MGLVNDRGRRASGVVWAVAGVVAGHGSGVWAVFEAAGRGVAAAAREQAAGGGVNTSDRDLTGGIRLN